MDNDTVKLLRECDAGVKMAISSIDETREKVQDIELKEILEKSKKEHSQLGGEIAGLLLDLGDNGKDPNLMAKGMSWMKTNIKLGMDNSDKTVADLITDGCDMGIKSLSKYLNQYEKAEEHSKDITKKLIKIEEDLLSELRQYL